MLTRLVGYGKRVSAKVLENVGVAAVFAVVGIGAGFVFRDAIDADPAAKRISASVDSVVSADGDSGIGRNVLIKGRAHANGLPSKLEFRLGLRLDSGWYVQPSAMIVTDGQWETSDFIGDDKETKIRFVANVLFGSRDDFDAWKAMTTNRFGRLDGEPTNHGIHVLADRTAYRTR